MEHRRLFKICLCLYSMLFSTINAEVYQGSLKSGVVFHFCPSIGNDTECLKNSSAPCKYLNMATYLLKRHRNNVSLVIDENCSLTTVLSITPGSSYIKIVGALDKSGKVPVISCNNNSGIKINGTFHVTIMNLSIRQCIFDVDSSLMNYAAVGILESSLVFIINVKISNSSRTTLYFNNCKGSVELTDINIMHNGLNSMKSMQRANVCISSAIYVEHTNAAVPVHYRISNSKFMFNSAAYSINKKIEKDHYGSYGGALHFVINNSNNSLIIENCYFSHNLGQRGGAMYLKIVNGSSLNLIKLINCTFFKDNAYSGGAVMVIYDTCYHDNKIVIGLCTFLSNSAEYGGGVSVFGRDCSTRPNSSNIAFLNCTWKYNTGTFSSVLDLSPFGKDIIGFYPTVTIENCVIENNTIGNYHMKKHDEYFHTTRNSPSVHYINSGVVINTRFYLYFAGTNNVTNNKYSAIVVVYGTIEFKEHSFTVFEGNVGYNGGALSLYGFSRMILNRNQTLIFQKNRALNYGGGIFYHTTVQHSLFSGDNCFMERLNKDNDIFLNTTQVIFKNNRAGEGNSIYSDSFAECFYQCNGNDNYNFVPHYNYSDITNCLGNFSIPSNSHEFVSGGVKFIFDKNYSYNYKVIPGQQLDIPFHVVDEFGQLIKPLMSVQIAFYSQSKVHIEPTYTLNSTVTVLGEPGQSSLFYFFVLGVRQTYFSFNVSLLPCPPGFYLSQDACQCGVEEYWGIVSCHKSSIKLKFGLWIGYFPEGSKDSHDLYTASTDKAVLNNLGYDKNKIRTLNANSENLSAQICGTNRTGILCGLCSVGTSSYFHSRDYRCGPIGMCHLGVLFYILSEVMPMIVLFAILIVFNLSLTSGNAVGLIFFAQYLNCTWYNSIFAKNFQSPYHIIYGLLNFEFFEIHSLSFCFWHTTQIQDILVLKHVTILLGLVLVFLLIFFLHNNFCNRICRIRRRVSAGTSIVHGLCAFLVLCYSQSSRTSFYILKYTKPFGFNNQTLPYHTYYGGLQYLRGHHFVYAIPSFISLILVTFLLPLVLIIYPLLFQLLSLCNLSEHKCVVYFLQVIRIHKLYPVIDCFQSCYRDKCRFFAGLYFVYRVILLYCYDASNPNDYELYMYPQIFLTIFLCIHCIVLPYKKRMHNVLDGLIFSNLLLINSLALLSEFLSKQNGPIKAPPGYFHDGFIDYVCLTLVYAPIIVVTVILVAKCVRFIKKILRRKLLGSDIAVYDILDYSRNKNDD